MRLVMALAGAMVLSGCGGGGTTGTNYSDPPPMAEILATPTPAPTAAPADDTPPSEEAAPGNDALPLPEPSPSPQAAADLDEEAERP